VNLFDTAQLPADVEFAAPSHLGCYTWSAPIRAAIREWIRFADGDCRLVHLRDGRNYDYTFTLRRAASSRIAREALRDVIDGFLSLEPPNGIMFLTDLCDDDMTSRSLHLLFAALRDGIASTLGDEFAALYAPVQPSGNWVGHLPLHADLYVSSLLLNVFDDVDDSSPDATFLSFDHFSTLLRGCTTLPRDVADRVISTIEHNPPHDLFDEVFDLLYGPRPWAAELAELLTAASLRLPARRGSGYVVTDRLWLHGRAPTDQPVPQHRIRRLTFDTYRTHRARRSEQGANAF
jgi:hypothetical protein